MKALVTGSGGFVGHYMRKELEEHGYDVVGLDLAEAPKTICINLLDAEQVHVVIEREQPDVIIHLAGQANVGASWNIPQKTFEVNVIGAINIMEAVRTCELDTHIVLVGSSDEYGNLGEKGVSVTEDITTKPQTPYAVSKKAQEELAQVYVNSYGMNICMTRSFNHCGPGQKEGFIVADFAAGIARVERGEQEKMSVGNLSSRRDFTHVADIVRAYRLIAKKGHPGEVYNVGSGTTFSAQEILDKIIALAECPIEVVTDPARMRPSDTPVVCCNHDKLTAHTGWEPEISIDEALKETLDFWRKQ